MDSTKHKMTQTTKKTTGLSLFKTEMIVINCLENLLYIVNVAAVRCCKQQEPDSLQSCLGHWSPPATASTASFCVSDVATLRSLLNTENCYLQPHMKRGRWSPELPGTEWPAFHLKTDDCPPMSASVGENTVHIMQFTCHGHITFPTPKLYYFLRDLIKKTLVVCQFDSDCSHRGKAEHYGSFQWTHNEPFSSRKANFLLHLHLCVWETVLDCMRLCSAGAQYLAGGESGRAVILERWCPLGWDAHFHIAECFPGRMQQHIAGETENSNRNMIEIYLNSPCGMNWFILQLEGIHNYWKLVYYTGTLLLFNIKKWNY